MQIKLFLYVKYNFHIFIDLIYLSSFCYYLESKNVLSYIIIRKKKNNIRLCFELLPSYVLTFK